LKGNQAFIGAWNLQYLNHPSFGCYNSRLKIKYLPRHTPTYSAFAHAGYLSQWA